MSEKFSLPWYALLFPLSQLVLLWRLTMQILATGHINPWGLVAAALFLLCVGTDILLFKTLRQSTQHEISVKRQQLMEQLMGKALPKTLRVMPPFHTDCGRNTTFGEDVFINAGCAFQDQGGITIGSRVLIGHHVVLATLNHDFCPQERATLHSAPIVIGDDVWAETFTEQPAPLTAAEKRAWLDAVTDVSLGSDAFFPFGDNIERARRSGVTAIVQPGGSIRDGQVIDTCNKYNIAMAFCGIRLFHH